MMTGEARYYDWEYANQEVRGVFHHIAIYSLRTGRRVAWAETEREANEKIDSLERHVPEAARS